MSWLLSRFNLFPLQQCAVPGLIFPLSSQSSCRCSLKESWRGGMPSGGRLGAGTPGGAWGIGESKEGGAGAGRGIEGVVSGREIGEELWRSRG